MTRTRTPSARIRTAERAIAAAEKAVAECQVAPEFRERFLVPLEQRLERAREAFRAAAFAESEVFDLLGLETLATPGEIGGAVLRRMRGRK